ncbi:MAG TPA: sulfite exporter TauE/SafE family protein [Thermodesulfobacteriota bacterium]
MITLGSILIGLVAGIASGFFGIGGGLLMIPAMVYFFNLTQHQAQGTSLAVLTPPLVLFAAIKYYNEGNVNLRMAVFIALGFVGGAYLGATFVHHVSDPILKRLFGVLLLIVSIKMILGK